MDLILAWKVQTRAKEVGRHGCEPNQVNAEIYRTKKIITIKLIRQ